MPEPSRNAPCPCGSGKKYKRCCIDKPRIASLLPVNTFKPLFENADKQIPPLCNKYNSKELLKLFSLLQLQAQNHDKVVRLELIITNTINSINSIDKPIDFEELKADILAQCPRHHYEDPAEEFFTENIVFANGNNVVYPGISANGTEIVQDLINAITSKNNLQEQFIIEVTAGVLFLLFIHNRIAQKLGHSHREYEAVEKDELSFPSFENLSQQINYFSFTFNDIKVICDELNIPYNTIDQFVFLYNNQKINFIDPDKNPLLQKPFVFIDNEFILVLPTAELICINEFILTCAIKHKCLDLLIKIYGDYGVDEIYPMAGKMSWKPVKFSFTDIGESPKAFLLKESLWQFDIDKLAYITTLVEKPENNPADIEGIKTFSDQFTNRVKSTAAKISLKDPDSKIFLVNFTLKSRILGYIGLLLGKIENIEQQIHFNPVELQALTHNWKFDRLTLWKYAKYLDLAHDKIKFAPYNTHLSIFDWYKRNDESFFDSDKQSFDTAFFDFLIEGDVRRKGINKLDKIGIPIKIGDQFGYLQCIRKEEYYPVYISQEIHFGHIRNCLLKYTCPIWLSPVKERDFKADLYMNAILYWMNELHDYAGEYISKLGKLPVSIMIELDDSFYNLDSLDSFEKTEPLFKYKIDPRERQISVVLPIQLVHFLSTSNNLGEKYLMTFLMDMLGDLMKALKVGDRLPIEQRDQMIDTAIPLGNKKMITVSTGDKDLKIADIDIGKSRKIPDADISYLLENQVVWLDYTVKIPEIIPTRKEKVKLLNDLVSLHFRAVVKEISEYDSVPFLLFLMKRHESLIQKRAFRKLTYPVKLSCYGKYYDVRSEFHQSEKELIESNLAMRVLIEFTASVMSTGTKKASDDEVDMLLARIIELVNYGAISDEITFELQDPEIGLLPSGRIGISKRFENNTLKGFQQNVYNEEFDSYTEDFDLFFQKYPSPDTKEKPNAYFTKCNEIFKKEWGIALFDIDSICHAIASELFFRKKSVDLMKLEDLYKMLMERSDLTRDEITSFIKQLTFIKRDDILKPPDGYEKWEVYPWRYNRRLSYLIKPLINIIIKEQTFFLISVRHLIMVSENLLALFFEGTLKVSSANKEVLQLIADRNRIKGKQYRNEVYKWLTSETGLLVYEYEIKIKSKGFFKSVADKGDIDILAIDKIKKIIYSIECKNTSQAKIAYDFKAEIDNYLGSAGKEGLIQKHINRDTWLNDNKTQVIVKLGLTEDYTIQSLVISKNILPLKYLRTTAMPIFSFYDIKSGNGPF